MSRQAPESSRSTTPVPLSWVRYLTSAIGTFYLGSQAVLLAGVGGLGEQRSGAATLPTSFVAPRQQNAIKEQLVQESSPPGVRKEVEQLSTAVLHFGHRSVALVGGRGVADMKSHRNRIVKKVRRPRVSEYGKTWKKKLGKLSCGNSTAMSTSTSTVYAWMHIPRTGGGTGYENHMLPLEGCGHRTFPSAMFLNSADVHDFNTFGCVLDDGMYGTHCAASEIADCVEALEDEVIVEGDSAPPKVRFLTYVRHPVDRVLSEYFWWKSGGIPWTKDMVALGKNATLEEWVAHGNNTAHNRQALYFLLNSPFPERGQCIPFNGEKTLGWIMDRYGSVAEFNQLDLGRALADAGGGGIWDRFAFVGVLGEEATGPSFSGTFAGVSAENSLRSGTFTHGREKKKRRKQDELVTESTRMLIEERNQLDMQLYRLVLERLKGGKPLP